MTVIPKKRGDTWKFIAWITDDSGVAITDFTGWEIWLTLKDQSTDEIPRAQITLSMGEIVVTDAPTGEVTGTFDADDTSEFPVKNYVADWRMESDTGIKKSSSTFTIQCVIDITGDV